MELNPKHPATAEMREQWHKIAAILLVKFKQKSVDITAADVIALAESGTNNIVIKAKGEVLTVMLVDDVTALRLSEVAPGDA